MTTADLEKIARKTIALYSKYAKPGVFWPLDLDLAYGVLELLKQIKEHDCFEELAAKSDRLGPKIAFMNKPGNKND